MIDISMLYCGIVGVFLSIPTIIIFTSDHSRFSRHYFIQGLLGSLASTAATTSNDFALGMRHSPKGPVVALSNVRIILVLIVDTIMAKSFLSSMQWIGLFFGIVGTLILCIPDKLQ